MSRDIYAEVRPQVQAVLRCQLSGAILERPLCPPFVRGYSLSVPMVNADLNFGRVLPRHHNPDGYLRSEVAGSAWNVDAPFLYTR